MADQLKLTISRNTLIDRLRKLHDDLSNENYHTEAVILDLAIQSIATEAEQRVLAAAERWYAANWLPTPNEAEACEAAERELSLAVAAMIESKKKR